jgi:hypothetical protein
MADDWVRMIKELASSRTAGVVAYTLPCSRVRGKWRVISEVRAAIYVGISGGAFAGCGRSEIISSIPMPTLPLWREDVCATWYSPSASVE